MRLLGLLAAPLLLAGCMGGNSSPGPHGTYQAQVTIGGSGTRTVWLDADGGGFRVSLSTGHGRKVTTSDGHAAVTRFRGFMTRTTGSAGFLQATVDPAVAVLSDRLDGNPVPAGDRVAGLHRVRGPSASLFTVPAVASPNMVVRQIAVGAVPATVPRPYWPKPAEGLAIVVAAGETVMLSGPTVRPENAVRLARALRPV